MTTITLRLVGDEWLATWSGCEAEHVRRLFGTTTIPTPFRARAAVADVLATVTERNPGCLVVVLAS